VTTEGSRRGEARGAQLVAAVAIGLVLLVALVYIAFGLATAQTTLGCDYFTYADAAQRHLDGLPIYPSGAARTGECGLYQYSPPFLLLVLPFVVLSHNGLWIWIAAALGAFVVGCGLMPVQRWIRLGIFLIGAVGWPFIFGLRIGQVGPLLFLLFALGWRFVDRPAVLGVVTGIGAIVKVQPGLVLLWLLARLNIRAIGAALVTIALLSLAAAAVGLADWPAFLRIVREISNALDIPANLSIGATLYQLGVDPGLASAIQTANAIALLGVVVWAGRGLDAVPGYLVVIIASQIISPIVWSHYALILLLPVAWLIERRQWWAALIPLVHVWILLPFVPNWTYPLAFYATLAGVIVVGWRLRAPSQARLVDQTAPTAS
jgi:alpha-1,2-mannosyltransferase